jgi:hypothetical protein
MQNAVSVQKSTCRHRRVHVAEVLQNFIAQLNTGRSLVKQQEFFSLFDIKKEDHDSTWYQKHLA